MSDLRQKLGARQAPRRMVARAMTVVLSSVVVVAFGATTASATPTAVSPPAPTGSITSNTNGTVTVTASGQWSWTVGTASGDINAKPGAKACGTDYGVGWGVAWGDTADPGYTLKYGTAATELVGSTTAVNGNAVDESVHFDNTLPCGTLSGSAVTGAWTDSHTYANASSVPTSICVVTYVLKSGNQATHPNQYLVDKNKHNSFHTAVNAGTGAAFSSSSSCFDPASLKVSPTIVTTATNAQVGSAITDSAVLSGAEQAVTAGATTSSAGGTITFALYGPNTTACTTPIYTSPTVTVNGNGTYGPASYTPTQGAGTYQWVASYSGDIADNGATEVCGAAGETSTLSAAAATTTTNSPTSTTSSTTVTTASTSPSTAATAANTSAISGASTVHTGEPWAGSKPYVVALIALGFSLMGFGFFERRRIALRKHAESNAPSTD
jgi:hypothetical protein